MVSRSHIVLAVAILASLGISLLSPHLNSYYLDVAISVGVNVILAVSLNLINGYKIGRASCRERVYVLV